MLYVLELYVFRVGRYLRSVVLCSVVQYSAAIAGRTLYSKVVSTVHRPVYSTMHITVYSIGRVQYSSLIRLWIWGNIFKILQEVVVNIIVHYKKLNNSTHYVICILKQPHHPNY